MRRRSNCGCPTITCGLITLVILIGSLTSCARKDPKSVYDHAWAAFQHGDLTSAEHEADRGYKDFHLLSSDWAWKFTILKSRVLYERGLYQEVLKQLSSEPATPEGELVVQRHRFEGMAYTSLHLFSEADRVFNEAERICVSTQYVACGDVANARGMLEMARGNYGQGQQLFERVLAFARAGGDRAWEAEMLLNLSWAADEQTHFDEALDWADAARSIALASGVGDLAQTAAGNIGWARYKLGDLENARATLEQAGKEASSVGNRADEIRWLTDLGYVEMDSQQPEDAERSFQKSLELARQVGIREATVTALQALAFVSEQTAKLDDAKRYADEALSMARADGNKRDETYPRLVQGRVAAQQHDAATAEAAFHEVAESKDSPVFLKWEAERSLARLYEDENQSENAAREYRTALSTFESARSELQHETSRLPFLTNASGIYDDYIHFLVTQGKTAEALQVADYHRGRTLAEGLGLLQAATTFKPDPVNAQAIAGRAGGTILFYWLGEKKSYLWAITPRKTELFTLPPKSQIDPAVQRYRTALANQQEFLSKAEADGRTLYQTLVAPAQALLPKSSKVVIIPDGSLNTLNFETLLVPAPDADSASHYWIEDATIADASSLHLLAAARATAKHASSLLLLGNAVSPNPDYPELQKAALEMESIEKHFPAAQQQAFAREKATPTAYLANKPQQFSYIHFVAHGTASRTSPLDSAIVLSRATAEDDSFKLYARDIIHAPLRADLVTISTCYGAGARAYSGEGLVGLSWAFLRAGAHNVVGALWEVSDVSTPQLMDELYGELMKGKPPDVALRDAKLSLLHSSNSFRKPFYWAPFQLYTGS
jgi:CHAT domain-containing protein